MTLREDTCQIIERREEHPSILADEQRVVLGVSVCCGDQPVGSDGIPQGLNVLLWAAGLLRELLCDRFLPVVHYYLFGGSGVGMWSPIA